MQLKPFFTYYGGKYRAAPNYPSPLYNRIVEPFAGSAGYSLRHYEREVILVDKDEKICAIWDFLINCSRQDILNLPNVGEHQSTDDFNIEIAAKYLIGFWLNKGAAQPCKRPSSWMKSGLRPNSYWGDAIRNRIASQCEAIKHWRVLNGSYDEVDFGLATYFVDPPYQCAGKHYRHGSGGFDFSALGAWCKQAKGQVMVCENTGADWLPFTHFMDSKASEAKNGGKSSKEAIWTNISPTLGAT